MGIWTVRIRCTLLTFTICTPLRLDSIVCHKKITTSSTILLVIVVIMYLKSAAAPVDTGSDNLFSNVAFYLSKKTLLCITLFLFNNQPQCLTPIKNSPSHEGQ